MLYYTRQQIEKNSISNIGFLMYFGPRITIMIEILNFSKIIFR